MPAQHELKCCFDQIAVAAEFVCGRDPDSQRVRCFGLDDDEALDGEPRLDAGTAAFVEDLLHGVDVHWMGSMQGRKYAFAVVGDEGPLLVPDWWYGALEPPERPLSLDEWLAPIRPVEERERGITSLAVAGPDEYCAVTEATEFYCRRPADDADDPAFESYGFGFEAVSYDEYTRHAVCASRPDGSWRCRGPGVSPSPYHSDSWDSTGQLHKKSFGVLAAQGLRDLSTDWVGSDRLGVCLLRAEGTLWCTKAGVPEPEDSILFEGRSIRFASWAIPAHDTWAEVEVRINAILLLDEDGSVHCYGEPNDPVVRECPTSLRFQTIRAGTYWGAWPWACGLTLEGELGCWGDTRWVNELSVNQY